QYLLETLRQNNAPKHLMPVDYSLQGCLETFPVPVFHIYFGIAVTGNVSQLNPFRSADQVGLLEIGQREWFKAIQHIRINRDEICSLLGGGLPFHRRQTQ